MQCPSCGSPNRQGRRFCGGCGARLDAAPVSACGFANEPDERYCAGCGAPLGSAAALPSFAVPRPTPTEPERDAAALRALALRCARWSPRVALDGPDDIRLDLTGCAHLFGGETGVLADVATCFGRYGLAVRAAIAGRGLAAWAWGCFGPGGILPDDAALHDLPVPGPAARLHREQHADAALALDPGEAGKDVLAGDRAYSSALPVRAACHAATSAP